jgi:hypothetical protein
MMDWNERSGVSIGYDAACARCVHREIKGNPTIALSGRALHLSVWSFDPEVEELRRRSCGDARREEASVEHEAVYRVIARQPDQARNEMANRLDCVLRELRSFVIRASGSP